MKKIILLLCLLLSVSGMASEICSLNISGLNSKVVSSDCSLEKDGENLSANAGDSIREILEKGYYMQVYRRLNNTNIFMSFYKDTGANAFAGYKNVSVCILTGDALRMKVKSVNCTDGNSRDVAAGSSLALASAKLISAERNLSREGVALGNNLTNQIFFYGDI
jgi:hypothetical protein